MFDRFTDRARRVMGLAREEAVKLNHEYLGTEHILLGLIQEGSGCAANVLRDLKVDSDKVRREIQKIVQSGSPRVIAGQLPFTPRAKVVLECSVKAAAELNNNYIGTEHLLLGLIAENEGVGAQVLMNLGLKLNAVKDKVIELSGAEINSVHPPIRFYVFCKIDYDVIDFKTFDTESEVLAYAEFKYKDYPTCKVTVIQGVEREIKPFVKTSYYLD